MNHILKSMGVVLLAVSSLAIAGEKKPVINWSSKDIKGTAVTVPTDRPTVLAFIRADQEQTREELSVLKAGVSDPKSAGVILILSGPLADKQAQDMAGEALPNWSVVSDPEFAASGKFNIHVWPTTVVVNSSGEQVAHLAGISRNLAGELDAYLAYSRGQIDAEALQKRLTAKEVIADGPKERAARHVRVAQQLLQQGSASQARMELEKGLALQPADTSIKLMLARVFLAENKAGEAIGMLDSIPADATGAWRIAVVRMKALIALEKWAEAKNLVEEVTKLNPEPAEALYLTGQVWRHEQDWQKAAEAFRAAYEATQNTGNKP